MSKGDNRRPSKVTKEEFESNWAKTFGGKRSKAHPDVFPLSYLIEKWGALLVPSTGSVMPIILEAQSCQPLTGSLD